MATKKQEPEKKQIQHKHPKPFLQGVTAVVCLIAIVSLCYFVSLPGYPKAIYDSACAPYLYDTVSAPSGFISCIPALKVGPIKPLSPADVRWIPTPTTGVNEYVVGVAIGTFGSLLIAFFSYVYAIKTEDDTEGVALSITHD